MRIESLLRFVLVLRSGEGLDRLEQRGALAYVGPVEVFEVLVFPVQFEKREVLNALSVIQLVAESRQDTIPRYLLRKVFDFIVTVRVGRN